jgi:phosphotransferase system  glucose/maltose/N-acetylglucosamine-specific IIC component
MAVIAAVIWSAVAWGASALLTWAGALLGEGSATAQAYPDAAGWLGPLVGLLAVIGNAGIVIVWIVGLIAIVVVYFVARLVVRRSSGSREGYGDRSRERWEPYDRERRGWYRRRGDDDDDVDDDDDDDRRRYRSRRYDDDDDD